MKNLRKGIFGIVRSNNEATAAQQGSLEEWQNKDWSAEGKSRAANMNGSEAGLLTCLAVIYQEFRKLLVAAHRAEERTKPQELRLATENAELNAEIERAREIDNQIQSLNKKNESLEEQVRDIQRNPEEALNDVVGASKVGLVIGLVILVFLTVYLFIFYSSASYSALFKQFEGNLGVAAAIFDPQALTNAAKDGIPELILLLTIPFVFLALGYLIHKFQEDRAWTKWLKIGALLVVTFIFDAILAYSIEKKIYDYNCINNTDVPCPEFNLAVAFQEPNFWLIIFAGFIVYVVWGFVFDFVMDAYEKLNKVASRIKLLLGEISDNVGKVAVLSKESAKSKEAITKRRTTIEILEAEIEFNTSLLKSPLNRFLEGWLSWLAFMERTVEKDAANKVFDDFVRRNLRSNKEN